MQKVDMTNQTSNTTSEPSMGGGLMGAMAGIMGAMANHSQDNTNASDDVIDVQSEEIKEIEAKEPEVDLKSITIKTATPFIINTNKSPNSGKDIATLTFLCVLEDENIITISRNYILDTEDDKDAVECIDFHADNEFVNNKICYNFIAKYLPAYFSTFKFKVDDLSDYGNKHNLVTLECINITDKSKTVEFRMNTEIFCSMAFIDDYIFNGEIENEHDLQLATVVSSKINNDIEFFVVEEINNIISMVSTKKKPKGLDIIKDIFNNESHTGIGVVFRVTRTQKNDNKEDYKETVSLLMPFDIGEELDKSKFKGDTVESLEQNYYGDADQYVGTLLIDEWHLEGVDKSYMIIRGKTKNGTTRVFLLDSAIKEDLIHKIKEY